MKKLIKNVVECYLNSQRRKGAMGFYKNTIRYNPNLGTYLEGEDEWLKKWRQYDSKISPLAYRVFGRYIGPNIDIVPLEICSRLETVLAPYNFNNFYSDKNSLDLIFPSGTLPETFLRNVRGVFLDKNYFSVLHSKVDEHIKSIEAEKIVLKPTMESSGHGVCIFYRGDDGFENKRGEKLSADFLLKTTRKIFSSKKLLANIRFLLNSIRHRLIQ